MQAALTIARSPPPPAVVATTKKNLSWPSNSTPMLQIFRCPPIKAAAATTPETSTVDYSSMSSVFPAEACETIGGEACDVEMYPEVKLKPQASTGAQAETASEPYDREYMDYDSPKTVFLEEACDDLGGEFCKPEYQAGLQ